MCVPISFMGRSLGVLHATGPDGEPPDAEQVAQLTTLATQAGARIGTVRAFEKTQLQASTDGLTGLINRRTLETHLRTMLRQGTPFALAVADLDHFKQLNDTHGHEAGDRSLRVFSQATLQVLRDVDLVARWGGEEFVIALPDTDCDQAVVVLERVRSSLALAHQGGHTPFTASFGVTDSTKAETLQELIQLADVGLYMSKAAGRDRISIADPLAPMPGRHDEKRQRPHAQAGDRRGRGLRRSAPGRALAPQRDRWYERNVHVAHDAVTAESPSSRRRYPATELQAVPGRTTSRAARTPQSTGLNFATVCIQSGICLSAIIVDERKRSGRPMKFATAIIVASRRVSNAIACETPANALLTRTAARMIVSQPSAPVCTRTPRPYETSRITTAWIAAVSAERTICESTSENREAGVARKRSITLWSRSAIIDMPLHVAPKNAFMTTIAGARNVMYDVVPKPPRRVTFLNSCP